METFTEFLTQIENPQQQARMTEVLDWVAGKFPELVTRIAWSQPVFTDHGTYIIGFSLAKNHMAVAPEHAAIERYADEIVQAGYDYTRELIRLRWEKPVDYDLLEKLIRFNIQDKTDCKTFWRRYKADE